MRNFIYFLSLSLVLSIVTAKTFAEITESMEPQQALPVESVQVVQSVQTIQPIPTPPLKPFVAFTGKVTKNKVRVRHQPNLEGPILRELNEGMLLIVVDETDDFYAIQPPKDVKAYVFRTFILDNVVEGNHVNIRIEPDIEAPIIGQLNSGDPVKGIISPANNKWLEIAVPASTRFYISKEYVQKIGDVHLLATIEKRREEVHSLLNATYLLSQTELQKPFPDINPEPMLTNCHKVIKNYSDFPEQVNRAKELLSVIQDSYLLKKIAYLETQAQSAQHDLQTQQTRAEQIKIQEERIKQLEDKLEQESKTIAATASSYVDQEMQSKPAHSSPNIKMAAWFPIEEKIFASWQNKHQGSTKVDFYQQEKENSIALNGVLEPYTRSIKNKPGDFLLVNQTTHQPIAYLYSTFVDLHDRLGQEINIKVIPRPNNHFAFPAFFVLSVED